MVPEIVCLMGETYVHIFAWTREVKKHLLIKKNTFCQFHSFLIANFIHLIDEVCWFYLMHLVFNEYSLSQTKIWHRLTRFLDYKATILAGNKVEIHGEMIEKFE